MIQSETRYRLLPLFLLVFMLGSVTPRDEARSGVWIHQIYIERFYASTGEYPNAIEDVFEEEYPWEFSVHNDPWGQPLSYRKHEDGYELFSNGPDRLPGTWDDIAWATQWGSCTFVGGGAWWRVEGTDRHIDPRDKAAMCVAALDRRVRQFCEFYMRYPQSMEEFVAPYTGVPDSSCQRELVDPWGSPYVFRLLPVGYDVISAGPDRRPDTTDDIRPGYFSEECSPQDAGAAAAAGESPQPRPSTRSLGCACSFAGR